MTSISTLIDFLMSLMRDEDTKREFDKNPEGTMANHGVRDVSAQDVRDARLMMADDGTARPREDGGDYSSGHHDGGLSGGGNGAGSAVREIVHTTNTFEIDQSRLTINVDNSRTNILDSFNSQDTVTAIQDNDTVNNDVDVVNVEDSFNDGDKPEDAEDKGEDTEDPKDGEKPDGEGEVSIQPVETEEPVDFSDPNAEPGGEVSIQPVDESDEPAEEAPPEPVHDEAAELYPADEPTEEPADDLPVA
jgi:hypothetical protein